MPLDKDSWGASRLKQEIDSAKEGDFILSNEAAAMMVVARALADIDSTLEELVYVIKNSAK